MLGHFPRQAEADPAVLLPWLKDVVLREKDGATTDIKVRLRGNILHVLCESVSESLPKDYVLMRLVRSLMEPKVKARLEEAFPAIHQIYVYNRQALEAKPAWSAPIYLNRLERHLERLVEGAEDRQIAVKVAQRSGLLKNSLPDSSPDSSLLAAQLSDISLARQGDSEAIARYLSEALSALNVGVQVSARVVPGKARRSKSVISVRPSEQLDPLKSDESSREDTAFSDSEQTADDLEEGGKSDVQAHVQAAADAIGAKAPDLVSRLWIFCSASYSPDPLLIAEPIAQRLRQLRLRQFQDAVITIQVTGEAASDWRLRVDLTPPEEMLQEWATWGDVPALSKLVNSVAKRYGLKLVAEVKQATLHLISYPIAPVDNRLTSAPDASENSARDLTIKAARIDTDSLVKEMSRLLLSISPRGIERAMLYGPSTDDISPEWLRGINLPGATQPALMASAASLVAKGNMPALAYCLTRSLNLDINDQLATGGIRVQLLLKDKLLHVMTDGPVCPPKHAIVPLVNQTLEPLKVPGIEGIRLYGRRAGQKQPTWSHSRDYTYRARLVPEAKPEFAASESYAGELIMSVSDESLTADGDETREVKIGEWLVETLRYILVKSQAFSPVEDTNALDAGTLRSTLPSPFQSEGLRMAAIWGVVGLLIAVQFDWMVGRALGQAAQPEVATVPGTSGVERVKPSSFNEELAGLDWNGKPKDGPAWDERDGSEEGFSDETFSGDDFLTEGLSDEGFSDEDFLDEGVSEEAYASRRQVRLDSRDFTASAIDDNELIYSPQQEFVSTSALLAGSTLPSFNSQQLDEKLALYRRRVAQSGPPDVLVIGSSRALRGIDPAALRQALDASDRAGLSVFNFGVNGATAQVVDLIVRRLIAPDQLPQLVVWADGARAFNSGRTDVTFDAIAASEGYRQLEASSADEGIEDLALGSLADLLKMKSYAVDRQLSEFFGQASSAYVHRGKIRAALGQGFGVIAPDFSLAAQSTQTGDTPTELPTETSLIDFDGFLALSTRFNPATYYNDHARVAGAYDGDYKAFRLDGKQATALEDLLRFSDEKQLPIVFVNTPLTDEYLDSRRSEAEQEFQQYMTAVAALDPEFTFRDLGQLWPQRYDYFSDPSHLNRYGAYQVAQRLAQDPLIEWPEALPTENAEL